MLYMARSNSMSSSLSALEALHRNDRELAISTLEAQLKSGMTVLYALSPDLKDDERRSVQEVLQNAEEYAAKHNLSVVRPTN